MALLLRRAIAAVFRLNSRQLKPSQDSPARQKPGAHSHFNFRLSATDFAAIVIPLFMTTNPAARARPFA
jgi:hypothetical protein